MASGYLDPGYAAAIAGERTVVELARSGGRLIVRDIPGTTHRDAMAPYPFLVCSDWTALAVDLADLPADLVTVTAVTDPLADVTPDALQMAFNRVVRPYKRHFVADLTRPLESYATTHHLRCAERALKALKVERCPDAAACRSDWQRLYAYLADRHAIRGEALMSDESFRRQFAIPGLNLFRALKDGDCVGMSVFVEVGDAAYYHLAAFDERGYRAGASYALLHAAIEHFAARGLRRMSLGAGAGTEGREGDGLNRFKQGWASDSRTAYLCGHVVDADAFECLAARQGASPGDFFPPYRSLQDG